VLRAALASRDAALNRDELAASEKDAGNRSDTAGKVPATTTAPRNVRVTDEDVAKELTSLESRLSAGKLVKKSDAAADERVEETVQGSSLVQLVNLPATPRSAPTLVTPQRVPDVRNLSLRQAVRALHSAGFRVKLETGAASATTPAGGTVAGPGTVVVLTRPRE
jgi:hypothetical protein